MGFAEGVFNGVAGAVEVEGDFFVVELEACIRKWRRRREIPIRNGEEWSCRIWRVLSKSRGKKAEERREFLFLALTFVAMMEATRRRQDSTASHLMVVEGGIVEDFSWGRVE
jgi:hypothetical protein